MFAGRGNRSVIFRPILTGWTNEEFLNVLKFDTYEGEKFLSEIAFANTGEVAKVIQPSQEVELAKRKHPSNDDAIGQ